MNISKDILSMIRSLVDDYSFSNLLSTCKALWKYKFERKLDLKHGRLLGYKIENNAENFRLVCKSGSIYLVRHMLERFKGSLNEYVNCGLLGVSTSNRDCSDVFELLEVYADTMDWGIFAFNASRKYNDYLLHKISAQSLYVAYGRSYREYNANRNLRSGYLTCLGGHYEAIDKILSDPRFSDRIIIILCCLVGGRMRDIICDKHPNWRETLIVYYLLDNMLNSSKMILNTEWCIIKYCLERIGKERWTAIKFFIIYKCNELK